MDSLSAIASTAAFTSQAIALTMIKNATQDEQQIADLLQSSASVPGSAIRGANIDINA